MISMSSLRKLLQCRKLIVPAPYRSLYELYNLIIGQEVADSLDLDTVFLYQLGISIICVQLYAY